MQKKWSIALAGNPNAGKSTLFNALTGARQHVGNYPGVTVAKKYGVIQYTDPETTQRADITVVDLPGTYSLTAYSIEEIVARDFLVIERPDVVVNIVDASNLERNLYLTCQFLELGIPVVLALNMIDVAKQRGIEINCDNLEKQLGIPVVPLIARSGKGIDELLSQVAQTATEQKEWHPRKISYGEDIDTAVLSMEKTITEQNILIDTYPARWTALKFIEGDDQIIGKVQKEAEHVSQKNATTELIKVAERLSAHLDKTIDISAESLIADHRYGHIKAMLRHDVLRFTYDTNKLYISDRIDRVLTNRLLGPVIMVFILYGLYTFTFSYSELPVSWLVALFGWLGDTVSQLLPDGPLRSLLVSGIIDGVGGVVGFVPLIMFMFFGISIMEDTGYLARVAFMMDRVLRIFGLHGSSIMPYIVSGGIAGGCAVPGVMAARTLKSPRERMATILTVPFMNCGAKLPVLALLIGTFFASHQAALLFLSTLLGWAVALLAALIFRKTILRGESTPFVMELPPYRFPTLKGLCIHTWEKTWEYLKKAGTVILAISVLIWALMSYPGVSLEAQQNFENQRLMAKTDLPAFSVVQAELARQGKETELIPSAAQLVEKLNAIDISESEYKLQHSFAGRFGKSLEKITWLVGFDWRTNIALIGGFAAKEVVISTLGTAYSLAGVDAEEHGSLSKTLAADPAWNPAMALALIVFIMFYAPCFVTVVCIVRETGTWKWGLFSMGFNTVFAFSLATVVYQIGRFFIH